MSSILLGVVIGLVPITLAWLAKTLFLKRQLSLVLPKLFDYSGLGISGHSRTLEVTVINSGRRGEEDVQVQFAPAFQYTVLASNAAGLEINEEGVLKIERLAPKQEVTLIIVAEGGEFRKEHVLGINSKSVVGKVKNSLQEAQSTPEQTAVALAVLFLFVFPMGYALGKIVEVTAWPYIYEAWTGDDDAQSDDAEKALAVEVNRGEVTSLPSRNREAEKLANSVSVRRAVRKQDVVELIFKLNNTTDRRLSYTISLTSPVSEQRDAAKGPTNYIEAGILVFPGSSKEVVLSEYLPPTTDPQILIAALRIEDRSEMVWSELEISVKDGPKG